MKMGLCEQVQGELAHHRQFSAMAYAITKTICASSRLGDSLRFKVILAAQGEYLTGLGVATPLVW
jgi:hypothetical protein